MTPVITTRIAELVKELGFGKLRDSREESSLGGKREAVFVLAEGEAHEARARVNAEVVEGKRKYLTRLFSDDITAELLLRGESEAVVDEARASIIRALAGGLHDAAGHFIKFAGARYSWPKALSKLEEGCECVLWLSWSGAIYAETEAPLVKGVSLDYPEAP